MVDQGHIEIIYTQHMILYGLGKNTELLLVYTEFGTQEVDLRMLTSRDNLTERLTQLQAACVPQWFPECLLDKCLS